MDATADNYDANAGCDDGSCVTSGCMDPLAFNYNINANTDSDPSSCVPFINGCTNALASNWNSAANTDDGTCIIVGCTYSQADNYNIAANDDDSSCTFTLGSNCPSDLDGDGTTGAGDLLMFLAMFGAPCQ
jgi:hypothetical protein